MQLGLWTLEERMNRADLLQVFKMYKGLSSANFSDFFTLSMSVTTRGHNAKIAKCRCHLDIRRFFFSSRVIDRWNRLQQSVIDSSRVNCFKNGLKHFDGLLYGLTEPLSPTAEPAPKIRLPVQVQPHLVCYLICIPGLQSLIITNITNSNFTGN